MKINFFIPMILITFAEERKTSSIIKNIKSYGGSMGIDRPFYGR